MAPRPYWSGTLKVALVTCAVTLSPVTPRRGKMRFHTINRATGNRIESRYVDAETGAPVAPGDEVKGFEIETGDYVRLEDRELSRVALESTRVIEVDCFVPRDSIPWIWLDQPHYLAPRDAPGAEAFAVIREAMAATATVGISRLVLRLREHAVMLAPRGKGIVLWTLRYGDEVRGAEESFPEPGAKPEAKSLAMMRKLIRAETIPWSEELVADPVEARLREIVARRKAARKPRKPSPAGGPGPAAEPGQVVSIFDALRRSVAAEKKKD